MTDKPKKCSICGKSYTGFGNNAEPVNAGQCCDKCNLEVVVPARLSSVAKILGSLGGKKAAENMTKEERIERARKAVQGREAKKGKR